MGLPAPSSSSKVTAARKLPSASCTAQAARRGAAIGKGWPTFRKLNIQTLDLSGPLTRLLAMPDALPWHSSAPRHGSALRGQREPLVIVRGAQHLAQLLEAFEDELGIDLGQKLNGHLS